MKKRKPTELKYPKETTFYIAWDRKKIKVYGSVTPENHFTTPWQKVDFYTDEEKWKTVLEKNGIELNEIK